MDWFSITGAHILSIMPPSNKVLFDAWIADYPDKAERIELTVAGVVAQFRAALQNNSANYINPDPSSLPQPMLREAEILTLGAIYQEMEKPLTSVEADQLNRAAISLRTYFVSNINFTPDTRIGFPTYNKRTRPATAATVAPETTVEPPEFTPGTDSYDTLTVDVAITSPTPGAVIRYTLDNTAPTASSPSLISGSKLPLTLPSTLNAYAFKRGLANSATVTAYYSLLTQDQAAYVFPAVSLITTETQLIAWTNAVPDAAKNTSPAIGSRFSVSVMSGTKSLVISYPASLPEFTSATQRSTGQQVRLSWINSQFSVTLSRFGVSYRVYQWMPAFAWSYSDIFDITL